MQGIDVKGKVVIVTGGGRGIGKGISTAFAREGANVAICGRSESALLETKAELESSYGVKVLTRILDISDEELIKAFVRETVDTFGKINALVNNAQHSVHGKSVQETSNEEFLLGFNEGLFPMWRFMKYCFPYLKESRGAVVNFGSGSAEIAQPLWVGFNSWKHAVRALSWTAAKEWGEYGITVNVIHPLVESDGSKRYKEKYPERFAAILDQVPMRAWSDAVEHVGTLCVWLCSEAGKGMTGQTLRVDGGSNLG